MLKAETKDACQRTHWEKRSNFEVWRRWCVAQHEFREKLGRFEWFQAPQCWGFVPVKDVWFKLDDVRAIVKLMPTLQNLPVEKSTVTPAETSEDLNEYDRKSEHEEGEKERDA